MTRMRGRIIANYTRNEDGEMEMAVRLDQRRAGGESPLNYDDTLADLRSVGPRKYWQYARGEY
jgi:hypothetical protein